MRKCHSILLLFALLTVSRSAPINNDGNDPGTGTDLDLSKFNLSKFMNPRAKGSVPELTPSDGTLPPPTTFIEPNESDPSLDDIKADEKKVSVSLPVVTSEKTLNPIPNDKAPTFKPSSSDVKAYIRSFASVFREMPIPELKLLADTLGEKKDPSEFEGMLGALVVNNNDGDDLIDKVDKIKDHLDLLHGILKVIISQKEELLSKNPPKPSESVVVSAEQNQGNQQQNQVLTQSQPNVALPQPNAPNQDLVPSKVQPLPNTKLDEKVEQFIDEQLFNAMKKTPLEDINRLRLLLNTSEVDESNLSGILKKLQDGIPSLTDSLIQVAAQYPLELKAVLTERLFENRLKNIQLLAPNSQTADNKSDASSNEQESVEPKKDIVKESEEKNSETENDENKDNASSKDDEREGDSSVENSKGISPLNANNPLPGDSHLDDQKNEEDESLFKDWGLPEQKQQEIVDNGNFNKNQQSSQNQNQESIENEQSKKIGEKQQPKDPKPQDPVLSNPGEDSGGWFGAWHFLIIFLIIAALVGVGYVCSHNKKKIREGIGSYISDASSRGRRARNYRYKPVSST